MILIALGSNLSFAGRNPPAIILAAFEALGRVVRVVRRSRLYVSPAWPDPADPDFVNAAASIETTLEPEALLAAMKAIEAGFGRRLSAPNAPRALDIDLIDYRGEVREKTPLSSLILPHPRAETREFVLRPLADIAPDWRHPVSGRSLAEMLASVGTGAARPLSEGEAQF